jgi:hypothetical protein
MYLVAFAKISDTSHRLGGQVVIPKSSILTNEKNKKFFQKTIDKPPRVCYNKDTK